MGPKIRKIARAIIEVSVCTVVMAMLSSLEINNFKGIKTGAISDLAQVNVLVGRNNSGKSTVLDALLLMRCAFAVTDYMGHSGLDQLIKRRIERPGKAAANQYRELHYMLNVNDRISLQAGFDNNTRVVQEWNRDLSQLVLHLLKDGSETDTRQRRIGVGHGCCRSTILSVGNCSGKMSVYGRTDIEYERAEPVTYLERSIRAALDDEGGGPAAWSK